MNEQLVTYISELLYKNECVIIPRFGGFVARYTSARISGDGSLISPPGKSILFNRNLQNNDGLLVNYIMEAEDKSYEEANLICTNFSHFCEMKLKTENRLELKEIGLFYLDPEKNIQFEPQTNVNYLIESFGLFPLGIKELEVKTVERIIDLKDRKTEVSKEKLVRQKYMRIAAVAITIPLIAIGVFTSFNNPKIKNAFAATFGFGSESVYKTTDYKKAPKHFEGIQSADVLADANGYASLSLNGNSNYLFFNISDTVSVDKTAVKKIKPVSVAKSNTLSGKYKIVVGCFSVEDNAKRLVNTLHERNIDASLGGLNKNGLHMVCAGSSNNVDDARILLQKIRQNYPSAWLLSN